MSAEIQFPKGKRPPSRRESVDAEKIKAAIFKSQQAGKSRYQILGLPASGRRRDLISID